MKKFSDLILEAKEEALLEDKVVKMDNGFIDVNQNKGKCEIFINVDKVKSGVAKLNSEQVKALIDKLSSVYKAL